MFFLLFSSYVGRSVPRLAFTASKSSLNVGVRKFSAGQAGKCNRDQFNEKFSCIVLFSAQALGTKPINVGYSPLL